MSIRLNKYLASLGVASRRQVDQFIEQKLIKINNRVATQGIKVDPEKDQITLNDKPIKNQTQQFEYYILNKPLGVITTVKDNLGRPTAVSLIKTKTRIFPVGRLDQDTEGLLLLTNDGDLTNLLTHPRYHLPKTYQLTLMHTPSAAALSKLAHGVKLTDGMTAPAEVQLIESSPATILLTIYEGRNRQIRRMCGALNLDLKYLKRLSHGPIVLGDLKTGQSRKLTEEEIKQLKDLVLAPGESKVKD